MSQNYKLDLKIKKINFQIYLKINLMKFWKTLLGWKINPRMSYHSNVFNYTYVAMFQAYKNFINK